MIGSIPTFSSDIKDDAEQAERARAVIDRDCTTEHPGWISKVVACELVWVLGRAYRLPRARIADTLLLLLETEQLRFEAAEVVRAAAVAYRDQHVDLADFVVGRGNVDAGCRTTLTFDATAASLPFFSPVADAR